MIDSSISCLPVWVCGCSDGCVADNKIPASNKCQANILYHKVIINTCTVVNIMYALEGIINLLHMAQISMLEGLIRAYMYMCTRFVTQMHQLVFQTDLLVYEDCHLHHERKDMQLEKIPK